MWQFVILFRFQPPFWDHTGWSNRLHQAEEILYPKYYSKENKVLLFLINVHCILCVPVCTLKHFRFCTLVHWFFKKICQSILGSKKDFNITLVWLFLNFLDLYHLYFCNDFICPKKCNKKGFSRKSWSHESLCINNCAQINTNNNTSIHISRDRTFRIVRVSKSADQRFWTSNDRRILWL